MLGQVQQRSIGSRHVLVWVNFDRVSAELWRRLFNLHSSLILDFRSYPRFDLGGLSRKSAFAMFKRNNIEYMDMNGSMFDEQRHDHFIDPASMLQKICEAAVLFNRKIVLVIVDKGSSIIAVERAIVPYLVKTTGAIWSSIDSTSIGPIPISAL
jgi:hypothetical protein